MRSAPIANSETIFSGNLNATRADAAAASVLSAHQQLGAIALATNPSNTQTLTLTVNSTAIVIHFVSAIGSTANNVLIGASAATTSLNLYNFLTNPGLTGTTQVAASAANQLLLSYLCFGLNGTTTTVGSMNKTVYAPLVSFACSTTVTSGSYTASTMKVYVEPGVAYVNGTQVKFSGGSSPTVTAPSANPRIDVLTLDSAGTLAWTTGSENASPIAPTYPVNKMPICEIYNVVSETIINDNENQNAAQGYILNDVRPFLDDPLDFASIPGTVLPTTDATYDLGSSSKQWNNVYAKSGIFVNGVGVAISKFGGTGADGALSVTSGTTTLNISSASYFEKNYTSISITGTGYVNFSNPASAGTIIMLKSQANVTLTSSATPMLDTSGCGGAGGAGSTSTSGTSQGSPGTASLAQNFLHYICGGGGAATLSASAGSAGAAPSFALGTFLSALGILKYPFLQCGAGGGSGGALDNAGGGTITGGAGGAGGGALAIECGGAWNFTTTSGISVAGVAGGSGSHVTASGYAYTGGSGGGGGMFFCVYNALTSNSGTVTVAGGAAGGNLIFTGVSGPFYGPGSGASPIAAGSSGGSSGSSNTSVCAAGANGYSLIVANTYLA